MDYQMFLKEIEHNLQERLGEETNLLIRPVMKNNSIILDSLSIIPSGEKISPVIYMNDYYRKYLHGNSPEQITEEILTLYQKRKISADVNIDGFTEWEKAEKRIVPRVVNREKNRKLLEDIPHRDYLDLSQTYAFLLRNFKEGDASITIRREHLEMWNITENDLHEAAFRNMDTLTPMQFSTMQEVMNQILPTAMPEETSEESGMYILTNRQKCYGAVWICREDVLASLPLDHRKGFYVLPSSVHECIILQHDFDMDARRMSEMVKEINETQVDPEEVLGHSVYYFSREQNALMQL